MKTTYKILLCITSFLGWILTFAFSVFLIFISWALNSANHNDLFAKQILGFINLFVNIQSIYQSYIWVVILITCIVFIISLTLLALFITGLVFYIKQNKKLKQNRWIDEVVDDSINIDDNITELKKNQTHHNNQ